MESDDSPETPDMGEDIRHPWPPFGVDKTEKATGVGRQKREQTVKWNQMTALRFQTGRNNNNNT